MLGFLLSAFSLSGIIAAPIMGKISDRTQNTFAVLLVANLFEIGGSIMYFFGVSSWFLVSSRFIAGIGTGVGAAILADITRVTTNQQRTGVLSVFMAVRQVGLIIGPGFNLFLRELNYKIGDYPVDKFTSPGLLMAVLWLLHQFMAVFFFWNLPTLQLQEAVVIRQTYASIASTDHVEPAPVLTNSTHSSLPPASQGPQASNSNYTINPSAVHNHINVPNRNQSLLNKRLQCISSSDEFMERAEKVLTATPRQSRHQFLAPEHSSLTEPSGPRSASWSIGGDITTDSIEQNRDQLHVDECHFSPETAPQSCVTDSQCHANHTQSSKEVNASYYLNEFVREEVVVLLFIVFVAFFNQMALETMVTPITKVYLHWSEKENSILFCLAGVEVVVLFIVIHCLTRCITDRTLVAVGFTVECATVAFFLWFLPRLKADDPASNLPGLIAGVFFDVFAIPFLAVSSASLYSKVTSAQTQGFAQGIRRVFVGFATILGPLWAGSFISQNFYILTSVMLALNFIAAVMLLLSFRRLKDPGSDSPHSSPRRNARESDSETRPLLA